jgi:CarD family transcriptional regulator
MPQKKKLPAKSGTSKVKAAAHKPAPKAQAKGSKPAAKTASIKSHKPQIKAQAAKSHAKPVAKAAAHKLAPKVPLKPVAKPYAVDKPHASVAHKANPAKLAPKIAPPRAVAANVSKAAVQKITAPAHKVQAPVQPASPKAIAEKAAAARAMIAAQKKPVNQRHGFKTGESVVYPAHGVGRIIGIEEQEIAGMSLELFVITFDKEKLTLRVPTAKLESVGMRKLADDTIVKKAMETLKGRARIKRTMWSRRAQEYVAKINSGDLISISEVVRDLYRSEAQPEQSYSERQLYEDALDRMAREIAVVEKLDERGAVQRITEVLSKSAKHRRAEAGEVSDDADVQAA